MIRRATYLAVLAAICGAYLVLLGSVVADAVNAAVSATIFGF